MAELASYALIDAEYYKTFVRVNQDNVNFSDDVLCQFINQASYIIKDEARRDIISGSTTEIFNGTGLVSYIVKNLRVTAEPLLYIWSGTAWSAYLTANYPFTYVEKSGEVYFTGGIIFTKGFKNWKIEYIHGWTRAAMPENLKTCCCLIIKWLYGQSVKLGVSSETFGNTSTSYTAEYSKLPEEAVSIINKYRVPQYG